MFIAYYIILKDGDNMENNKIIYADHSATTYTKKEVIDEMLPYFMTSFGNPSSNYSIGIKSKEALDSARLLVANAISCNEKEIYFTSGGSEADNLIIKGIARKNKERGKHIITSKIEHKAVLNSCKTLEKEGFEVTYINVNKLGIINISELINSIRDDTILISIMFANNEVGTIQPIKQIGNIAKSRNIFFHTDAVQAIGNVDIDVKKFNIDALSMSAHKFYGPKGVGAAYISSKIDFLPIIDGGMQELGKRAGTENVASIVGMGKAIEIAKKNIDKYNQKLYNLRTRFISNILSNLNRVKINGDLENRLPGNVNLQIDGVDNRTLLLLLNMNKICASGGSACNSDCSAPSHVLMAMGLTEKEAQSSIRFTFGEENTEEDIDYISNVLIKIVKEIRK